MIIFLKNKDTLQVDDFKFKCSIGNKGLSKKKKEGDKKTPKGLFSIGSLYYRADRVEIPHTKLDKKIIKKDMGWCDDINFPKFYNKPIKVNKTIKHEKLFRKDNKYDMMILIKYNSIKPKVPKGSCIFLHLTDNLKPTAGCIAIEKRDFLVLIKLINSKTKILID